MEARHLTAAERRRRRFLYLQTKRREVAATSSTTSPPSAPQLLSEDKKTWRKLKNRESAAASRKKRLETIESLSMQLAMMSREVQHLRKRLAVYENVPTSDDDDEGRTTFEDVDEEGLRSMIKRRRTHCYAHEPAVF